MPTRDDHERELFDAARGGDGRAREAIVELYVPLARQLARRYVRASEPQEDVEQVAFLALIKAVDRFDPDRGTAFSSYAVPCIAGAIKRHFRDNSWAVRVPRGLQELALRIQRLDDELSGAAGRRPTAAELAERAGVGVEDVLEAREAQRALHADSLDQPRRSDEDADEPLLDAVGAIDGHLERVVDRVALAAALATLEQRDREAVRLYYQHDRTQAEIAERLGYSQMHISRIIRRALARMRTMLAPADRGGSPAEGGGRGVSAPRR